MLSVADIFNKFRFVSLLNTFIFFGQLLKIVNDNRKYIHILLFWRFLKNAFEKEKTNTCFKFLCAIHNCKKRVRNAISDAKQSSSNFVFYQDSYMNTMVDFLIVFWYNDGAKSATTSKLKQYWTGQRSKVVVPLC